MNASEAVRRQSNTAKLREFFLARPNQWIQARDLEPIAGRQAWRTRVSELRVQLEKEGVGTVENRLIRRPLIERDAEGMPERLALGVVVRSEYRYVPKSQVRTVKAEIEHEQPELF